MKDIKISNKTLAWLAPLVMLVALMIGNSTKTPMWMDEYYFYRLAGQFPNYSTSANWIFKDRPALLNTSIKWQENPNYPNMDDALKLTYTTQVFQHTPLPVILMSPIVKLVDKMADDGVIQHLEAQPGIPEGGMDGKDVNILNAETITAILRIIPILMFAFAMYLIFKMLYKRIGKSAYYFTIPLITSVRLLTGIYFVYWDIFMMFFFVVAWYFIEMKPNSKWKYLFACCMINTKIFVPLLFLIPLVIKEWKDGGIKQAFKMCLTSLSIIPFWFYALYATGDFLYIWKHYTSGMYIHDWIYTLYSFTDVLLLFVSLGIFLLLLMTVPLFKYWKKYIDYLTFFVVAMIYAWGAGMGMTHMANLVFVGAMLLPLVVYEFNIIERLNGFLARRKLQWRLP